MKITKHITMLALALLLSMMQLSAQQKQQLSVLYVGIDPAVSLKDGATVKNEFSMTPERFEKEIRNRFSSFNTYLNDYFSRVKSVDAQNYTTAMSADYDVTIFDQTIKPFKDSEYGKNADGTPFYRPAKYLTEDIDFPVLFIGQTAPNMGASIGLKLDWLCLCLDVNAHHIKTAHPIFKGPFPVNITLKDKKTPESVYHYPSGKNVPTQIPMWRVQNEGFLDGKGYQPGIVSRGEGFLDSPDTEYISSGVNTKDVGAVAIGRHGNFFMWGFAASPEYLTQEAKQVLANAVVYIKKFKGQKPIARKYNERIATSASIDEIIGRLTKEYFDDYTVYLKGLNDQMAQSVKLIQTKKDSGTALTASEENILSSGYQEIAIPNWDEYVAEIGGSYYKPEYQGKAELLIAFLKENKKYMYSKPDASYELTIDQEAKALGMPINDIALLQKCISDLQKDSGNAAALTILERYTGMKKTPQQWQQWLKANRSKLFFTEAGGFKWLVNTIR